ncbi:MAG: hypothetical protein AB7O49_03150 [Sphingomonadales bacterium]
MDRLTALLLTILLTATPAAAWAQCATEGWQSAGFQGEAEAGRPETAPAGPYEVTLTPIPFGWEIGVRAAGGKAVPVLALPLRPAETNPVVIAGWHFRNAANSGPNTGDVNAPQTVRDFSFGALAVRGLADPALLDQAPGAVRPPAPPGSGRGRLVIGEYRLDPPASGHRASMLRMTFAGCLEWNTIPAEVAALAELSETLAACGLDTAAYRPSARMAGGRDGRQPLYLTPDMEGDGAPDVVAAIERAVDGAPGLAICLSAGNKLVLAGYDGRIGRHLDPAYFASVDWWGVHSGEVFQGGEEGAPPALRGEAVLIGKEDSSSALLYLDAALRPASYWQGD